jgi:hypothetical protein
MDKSAAEVASDLKEIMRQAIDQEIDGMIKESGLKTEQGIEMLRYACWIAVRTLAMERVGRCHD